MKAPLKVPVEPLSAPRWARLEKSLFARLEEERVRPATSRASRKALIGWLSAAALLGVLVLVLARVALWPAPSSVQDTSRITTGKTGSHLALPGLSLDVHPESVLVVAGEPERSLLIVLDRGGIVCDVTPRHRDRPLIVQAGAARVRVVGTRFSVVRDGDSARVEVQQGSVEVSAGGQSWRVGAGESWPAPAAVPPAGSTAPAGSAAEDRREESPAASVPEVTSARRAGTRARPTLEVAEPASGEVAAKPAARSAQAQFEEATRLERSDPARASALYRALEGGSDSWAQNALYARGQLAAARGDKAEARRLLERYLARYPGGTNAGDARAVLDRLR